MNYFVVILLPEIWFLWGHHLFPQTLATANVQYYCTVQFTCLEQFSPQGETLSFWKGMLAGYFGVHRLQHSWISWWCNLQVFALICNSLHMRTSNFTVILRFVHTDFHSGKGLILFRVSTYRWFGVPQFLGLLTGLYLSPPFLSLPPLPPTSERSTVPALLHWHHWWFSGTTAIWVLITTTCTLGFGGFLGGAGRSYHLIF